MTFLGEGRDPIKILKCHCPKNDIAKDYPLANENHCPKNTRISTKKFASFRTPNGKYGSYSKGERNG